MGPENTRCSGTWCDACSNNGCCEEQRYWDSVLELDSTIESKVEVVE
jgi:hypothetical protein